MDLTRSVGTYGRKQVPVEIRVGVFQFTAISSEKDSASTMPISNTDHIAFVEWKPTWFRIKYTVGILSTRVRKISNRVSIPTYVDQTIISK
jgi:hypothetical protein